MTTASNIELRKCKACGEHKPLDDFYREYRRKEARRHECKSCANRRTTEYRKEVSRETRSRWNRNSALKRYGISEAVYQEMLDLQDGMCAICGSPNSENSSNRLHVDHDHKTGTVRGLLCTRCNPGIGMFCDDPELMRRAIKYLERWA